MANNGKIEAPGMPSIVPCEWVECNCPGWHVVAAGDTPDLCVRLPYWFAHLGSHMARMANTPESWSAGNNIRVRNWLGNITESIDNYVRQVSLNAAWVRFVPRRFWVNAHCNGGGQHTQALANVLAPGWVPAYWGQAPESTCQVCGMFCGHGQPDLGAPWVDPR